MRRSLSAVVPAGSSAVRRPVCRPPRPPGSSAVPARVARQALFASAKAPSPPGWSAVPASVAHQAVLASVSVRRPRHVRLQGRPPSSFCQCQSAVPARVVRCARQDRPPSCFSECVPARVVRRPGRVVRRPCRVAPPSTFCECQSHLSAAPARVIVRRPRQGGPPSSFLRVPRPPAPPGSPAKLFERRPGPARVLALGDTGTQFYYCASWLAVPNQVWQTRSAWQSKQISKR